MIVADYGATWLADVSLSVTGTTPGNRSLALPLDILFLAEADQSMSDDLERLADLLPGFAAEVIQHLRSRVTMCKLAAPVKLECIVSVLFSLTM